MSWYYRRWRPAAVLATTCLTAAVLLAAPVADVTAAPVSATMQVAAVSQPQGSSPPQGVFSPGNTAWE